MGVEQGAIVLPVPSPTAGAPEQWPVGSLRWISFDTEVRTHTHEEGLGASMKCSEKHGAEGDPLWGAVLKIQGQPHSHRCGAAAIQCVKLTAGPHGSQIYGAYFTGRWLLFYLPLINWDICIIFPLLKKVSELLWIFFKISHQHRQIPVRQTRWYFLNLGMLKQL